MSQRLIQRYKAQVYEWGGCYEKMLEALTSLIYLSEFENYELNEDEMRLILSCVKQKVSESRTRICQILQEHQKQTELKNLEYVEICDEYIITLKKDIKLFLDSVNQSIDHLLAVSNKGKLFKAKMKSDISRYSFEFNFSELQESKKIQEEIYKSLKNYPDFSDPLFLGFILNFAVFLSERCNEKKRAVDILTDTYKKYEQEPKKEKLGEEQKILNNTIQKIEEYIRELE